LGKRKKPPSPPPPQKTISVTFSSGLLSTIGNVGLGLSLHGPV